MMNAFESAKELAAKMSAISKVVVRPDHPYLFNGPDLIAGNEGNLYAFFIRRKQELNREEELRARLCRTRLALPAHTVCVLVKPNVHGHGVEAPSEPERFS
jgi:hypothetical protein